MAEPTVPETIENIKLRIGKSSKGNECSYVLGKFLSIKDVSTGLTTTQRDRPYTESEAIMFTALEKVKNHNFQHIQVPIPVSKLQHVTILDSVNSICEKECFRGNNDRRGFNPMAEEARPEFDDLLFWSAYISPEDMKNATREAYNQVSSMISSADADKFEKKIQQQFANSPAFRQASRYGNFRFTFPLSYLLGVYKDQHCGGKEPQLRILSTETYKYEIAHHIIVHSPSTSKFNDFPEVPIVQRGSQSPHFVYWMDETLYWRPESTSSDLYVKISEDGNVREECFIPCYHFTNSGSCDHDNKIYAVWNHVIFAFHLPEDHLKVPLEHLQENLTPCDGDKPFLGRSRISKEAAEQNIQRWKNHFIMNRDETDTVSESDNADGRPNNPENADGL